MPETGQQSTSLTRVYVQKLSNGYREWSAQVLDLALRLGGLTVRQQQVELARLLNRSAPISRAALKEWRTGAVPVPMEVVKAACDLSGYGMAKIIELVPELEEQEAPQLQRGSQAGRIYLQLVPGGLGLIAAIIALLWMLGSDLQPAISAVENMAHRVISVQPPFVPLEIQPGATTDHSEPTGKKSAAVVWKRAPTSQPGVPNPGPAADSVPATDPAAAAGTAPGASPAQSSSCTPAASTAPATTSGPAVSSAPVSAAASAPSTSGPATTTSAPVTSAAPATNPASGTGATPGASCAPGSSSAVGTASAPTTSSPAAALNAAALTGPVPALNPAPVPSSTTVTSPVPATSPTPDSATAEDPADGSSESSESQPQPSPSATSGGQPAKQGEAAKLASSGPSGSSGSSASSDASKVGSQDSEQKQASEPKTGDKQRQKATTAGKALADQLKAASKK